MPVSPEEKRRLQAEWEAKLADEGFMAHGDAESVFSDPKLVGEENGKAVMVEGSIDQVDQQIIEQLADEGENNKFAGSPTTREKLFTGIMNAVDILTRGNEKARVGLHSSCITKDDCVVVSIAKGERHHFNTRLIEDYDREDFEDRMLNRGYEVTRIFDDS